MQAIHTVSSMMQRKKIWEIESCYKCTLIGLCLSRAELRKLSRDRIYDLGADLDDYRLHSCFIHIADQGDKKGRNLHKSLEKKFRTQSKKYLAATTDQELETLWHEDLAQGELAAAWWGIISHPLISADLTAQLYGLVHMLSHDAARSWHNTRAQLQQSQVKINMLQEVMTSERQQYRRENKQFQKELVALRKELTGFAKLQEELVQLREEIQALKAEKEDTTSTVLKSQRIPPAEQQAALVSLQEELETSKALLTLAENQLAVQTQQFQEGQAQQQNLAEEVALLERMLGQYANNKSPCQSCDDQHTNKCPGINLCGKTVLYVGGLHKMVPHYRQLVEQNGGCFLHHDGGREASRSLLPKMLLSADAVLCPIDCISHDACTQVKKMCKRYQKTFVPMRSSGLSSLAKGLSGILQ